ncbi:MAG: hypothetical protein IKB99_03190 [Lentisphaeria bacterium]|nr:hypothetical protein [Lentisphaeria bacterium]
MGLFDRIKKTAKPVGPTTAKAMVSKPVGPTAAKAMVGKLVRQFGHVGPVGQVGQVGQVGHPGGMSLPADARAKAWERLRFVRAVLEVKKAHRLNEKEAAEFVAATRTEEFPLLRSAGKGESLRSSIITFGTGGAPSLKPLMMKRLWSFSVTDTPEEGSPSKEISFSGSIFTPFTLT